MIFVLLFLSALFLSIIITPIVRNFAIKHKFLDLPSNRKIHQTSTPRLGGIGIFIAFNTVLFLAPKFSFFGFSQEFLKSIHFGLIFAGSMIVFTVGLIDDLKGLRPSIKLLSQFAGAAVVSVGYLRIHSLGTPFGTLKVGVWGIAISIIWIVAITNAFNLLDGLDGLAAGTSIIVCVALFGIALIKGTANIALITAILAGSSAGFIKYNFNPASIFLGDSGAYFLGYILAVITLFGNMKQLTTFAILVPILALGLPIIDTALAMTRRLLGSLHIAGVDKENDQIKFFFWDDWSLFRADKEHIHHRLIKLGFSQKKTVFLLYIVSVVFAMIAIVTVYLDSPNSAFIVIALGIATFASIKMLHYDEIKILSNGMLLPIFDVPLMTKKYFLSFLDIGLITISYFAAFLLRYEGNLSKAVLQYFLSTLPIVLVIKLGTFYLFGLFKLTWKHTSVADLIKVVKNVIAGTALVALTLWLIPGKGIMSRSVLIIDMILLLIMKAGARSLYRALDYRHSMNNLSGSRVLIFGIGQDGIDALHDLLNNPHHNFNPVGFIDDPIAHKGTTLSGCPILGDLNSLDKIISEYSISDIIIAQKDITTNKVARIKNICMNKGIGLKRFNAFYEDLSLHN